MDNIIENMWLHIRNEAMPGATDEQVVHYRGAFYAGAMGVLAFIAGGETAETMKVRAELLLEEAKDVPGVAEVMERAKQ